MTLRVILVVTRATLICLKYQIKCEQKFRNYEIYQFPKGFLRGLGLQSSLCAHSLPHSGEIPLKFPKELLQI